MSGVKQLDGYIDYLWKLGLLNGSLKQRMEDIVAVQTPPTSPMARMSEWQSARISAKHEKQLAVTTVMKVLSNIEPSVLEDIAFNLYENYQYSRRDKICQKWTRVIKIFEARRKLRIYRGLAKFKANASLLNESLQVKKLNSYVSELMVQNEKQSHEMEALHTQIRYLRQENYRQRSASRTTKVPFSIAQSANKRPKSRDTSQTGESVFVRLYEDSKGKRISQHDRSMHECTFRPSVISKRPMSSASTGSLHSQKVRLATAPDEEVFGRLYAQIYDKQHQFKANEVTRSKDETKQCTFHPKITQRKGSPDRSKDMTRDGVFHELYLEGKNKMEQRRRSLEAEQHHQLRELKYCTFAPRINTSKVVKREEGELFDRLYQESKEQQRKSVQRKLQQERQSYEECRFAPKIRTSSKDAKHDPLIFQKLHEDRTKLDKKLKDQQKEQIEIINQQVNSVKALPLPKHIYSPKFSRGIAVSFQK